MEKNTSIAPFKKLLFPPLLIALIVTFTLIGAGCNSDTPSSTSENTSTTSQTMKTYTNTAKGYTIQYPETWTERETGLTTADVIFNAPAINDFSPNLTISAKTFPSDPRWATLDKLKAYLIDGDKKQIKDFNLISSDNITLAGQPGFKIEFTSSDPESDLKGHSIQYWTTKGDLTYFMEVIRPQDKPTAYDAEFNAMIQSFTITK